MVAMISPGARRRLAVATWLAAWLLVATTAVLADWKDAYRRGREAFESGRFQVTVDAMREAIAERAEERSGTGFLGRRYTPRYYLGAALAELGDCRQALEVFAESERLGAIQDTVEFRDQNLRKQACTESLKAAFDASVVEARKAIAEADSARAPLDDLARALGAEWETGQPSLETQEEQAVALLDRAQGSLASAQQQQSTRLVEEATAQAGEALRRFRDTASNARDRQAELRRRRVADARTTVREGIDSAAERLRSVNDLKPLPPQLAARAKAVEDAIASAEARISEVTGAEATSLVEDLESAAEALAAAARRPPRSLRRAADRYFSGDFAGALEALGDNRYRERRGRDQACVLRAAAAWSLTRLEVVVPDDSTDAALAADASTSDSTSTDLASSESALTTDSSEPAPADAVPTESVPPAPTPAEILDSALARCRDLDPAPTPDARFFSPEFVAFFDAALAPASDVPPRDDSASMAGSDSMADSERP